MLPGRRYTPESVLVLLRKRAWLLLVPFALAAVGTALWTRTLPDLYGSSTTIQVVPQRISESIVQSTIQVQIEDRLRSIREAILSRPRLEALINEFDLYPDLRQTALMQDLIFRIGSDISIDIVRNDAFEISYTSEDPVKAMRVVERLGSLFIEQSLSYRYNLTEDTDQFLESQLVETRQALEAQERRLENYRRTYAGELPTQVQASLQQLSSANARMQQAVDGVNQLRQRRLLVERQLADLDVAPAIAAEGVVASSTEPAEPELGAARAAVEALELRGLKPGHPDLDAARRRMEDVERRLAAQLISAGTGLSPSATPAEARQQARRTELLAEMKEIDRQIAEGNATAERFREAADAVEARLDAVPTRETEMVALTRDYDIISETYRNLLRKQEEARISANLERRQVGEQFSIVDPARVSERPASPDRTRLNVVGAGAGLAFGLFLFGVIEYRDRAFRNDAEVTAALGLPVLAVVPIMQSAADRRRAFVRRVTVNTMCAAVVTASLVVCGYLFVVSV